jgi:hypothetical protein
VHSTIGHLCVNWAGIPPGLPKDSLRYPEVYTIRIIT